MSEREKLINALEDQVIAAYIAKRVLDCDDDTSNIVDMKPPCPERRLLLFKVKGTLLKGKLFQNLVAMQSLI